MKCEWKNVRLCDTPINIIDGDRGKNYPNGSDFTSSGYCLFLNAKNVTASGFSFEQTTFISKAKDELLRKGKLKRKDVVLTTRGTVGNVAYFDDKVNFNNLRINSGMVILRSDREIVNSTYLYWLFRSPIIQEQIAQIRTGSAQPQLPISIMRNLEFMLPSFFEQKAIADTLSCLDDKIELNNRMNRTLEEVAQAVFKSWFVDFEPFQGGEFVDSELGSIPKGWRVGTLGECIELFDSQRVPLSSRQREKMKKIYPYYGATSIMDYVDNYLFDGMYVLLGEDGSVVDDNGYPILQYVWGKFWVNNHAHILKGKSGFNEDSLYMLLRNTNVRGAVTGAVQLKINQANLKALKVLIPSAVDLEKYNSLLEPISAFRRSCSEETQKLILTRDSLLPKLMSGEIRVSMEAK